jgi:hypothetical protein
MTPSVLPCLSAIDVYIWLRDEFGDGIALIFALEHLDEIKAIAITRWA